jgi:hypothetical protein
MKKLWIIGIIAAFVGTGLVATANCGHCEGSKKAAAAGKDMCAKLLEGITLTDEQKPKVDEIQKACDGTKEGCAKAKEAIRGVLTADQQKAFDANVEKCSKGGACCAEKGAA